MLLSASNQLALAAPRAEPLALMGPTDDMEHLD